MITDALLMPLVLIAEWLEKTLPDGAPFDLPNLGQFWDALAGLNSLVPVAEVLMVALTLLSALVVFLTVRMVILLRHLVLP